VIAQVVSASQTQVVFKAPKLNPLPPPAGYQFSIANFDGLYAVAPGVLQLAGNGGGGGGGGGGFRKVTARRSFSRCLWGRDER